MNLIIRSPTVQWSSRVQMKSNPLSKDFPIFNRWGLYLILALLLSRNIQIIFVLNAKKIVSLRVYGTRKFTYLCPSADCTFTLWDTQSFKISWYPLLQIWYDPRSPVFILKSLWVCKELANNVSMSYKLLWY